MRSAILLAAILLYLALNQKPTTLFETGEFAVFGIFFLIFVIMDFGEWLITIIHKKD